MTFLNLFRLPRYKLLLKSVLKYTQEDHVDYDNLKSALTRISAVNSAINSKKKEHETYSVINRIFNDMKIFTSEQDLHLVKHQLLHIVDEKKAYLESNLKTFFNREGYATYTTTHFPKSKSMRVLCFLFEKILIIVAVEKKVFNSTVNFKYHHTILFPDAKWIEPEKGQALLSGRLDENLSYIFVEHENIVHALSFDRESPIADTHSDWAKKIHKILNKTEEEEHIANEKENETKEVLKICDAMFHNKFSSSSSIKKLDTAIQKPEEPKSGLTKSFSFLKKNGSSSIAPIKNDSEDEEEESEVKKFFNKITLNKFHF